jgi:hypothetical protein
MSDNLQQTTSAVPTIAETAPTPPGDGADDFDARLHALRAEPDASAPAPAPEAGNSLPPASASEADSDAGAKRAEERRARLAEMQARLRRQVDDRPARPTEDYVAKLAEAQKRLDEMQAAQSKFVDPSKLDEAGFFDLAKRLQVSPQKLGEFLREATLHPEVVAAQAAQKALDPRIAAAEERAAKAEQMVQQFIAEQHAREAQAREAAVMNQFVQSITPEEAPHAATFLQAFGPQEFLRVVESAASELPEGAGRQALVDVLEENLERLARAFVPPSSAKQTTPTPIHAAAKATTVSNTLAQTRASVVEDDDWASLPFEERLARMKASA